MTSISSSTFNVSSYSQTSGTSSAHGPGRHKPDFSKLDTDGSGGLSKSEFEAMIQNGPRGAGCGGSSNISSTSGTSSTDTSRLDELFSKLDTDGDGSISQTELEAGKPKDEASNNGLSQMGLSTSDFAQMMGAQGGMQMQGPPPGPPPGDSDGNGDSSSAFSAIDTDSDGSISKSEFLATLDSSTSSTTSTSSSASSTSGTSSIESDQLSKLFSAIDSDGSGSLSSSEVSDFRTKMQDIFGSLNQRMQDYGNQQYQWFSQDASGSSSSTQAISYNA